MFEARLNTYHLYNKKKHKNPLSSLLINQWYIYIYLLVAQIGPVTNQPERLYEMDSSNSEPPTITHWIDIDFRSLHNMWCKNPTMSHVSPNL